LEGPVGRKLGTIVEENDGVFDGLSVDSKVGTTVLPMLFERGSIVGE
jgi:hypothetical protein